jgi:LysM domain-containing protein
MSASRFLLAAVLLPAAALAEAPADQPGIDLGRAAAQLEGDPVAAAAPPAAAPRSSLDDAYTVKPGDTLWDLSGRFLNNPWYWPKVWSYNPEITNPHFIYPGNVVRFYPSAEEAPGRVEPIDVARSAPAAAEEDLETPRELEDLSRADMKKPQEIGEGDEVAVVGPYKIGYVPPKGLFARRDSFVTPRELAESGTITAAFEDKLLLTLDDRAYGKFAAAAPAKLGETYVLYRTERPVRHPETGELFGYQSTLLGAAKVVAVDDKAVTLKIAQAYEPIERGALIAPFTQKVVKQVQRRPNQHELSGVIVASQQELVSEIGEHHMVFLDKGRQDGVEEGNVFTVVRSGDPYGRDANAPLRDATLPKEDVGTLVVVDAQQTSSSALVVRSLRELYVGDHVEMRAGAALPLAGAGGN